MNFRAQPWTFLRFRSCKVSKKSAEKPRSVFRNPKALNDPPEAHTSKKTKDTSPETRHKKTRRRSHKVYYDPSNLSLDFKKPNHQILDEILANSEHRTRLRSHVPSSEWEASHGSQLQDLTKTTGNSLRLARVSLRKNLTPLGLGDLVLLDLHSTELYLVASEPQDLTSSVYTFVNSEGEILQGPKHLVKLRIPRVLSREAINALNLVTTERKHPGVAPIGMPEHDRNSQYSQEESPSSEHDLLVAQAQTQHMSSSNVETYLVSDSARQVYSRYLRQISIEAFQKVTTFSRKLDYMHNVLQYDQGNNIITSVQTISIFELFNYVCDFKNTLRIMEEAKGSRDEYRVVNQHIRSPSGTDMIDNYLFSGLALPKNTQENFAHSSHKVSSYIAFVIALSRSSRMWKINTILSSKSPLSVDILPVHKGSTLTSTIEFLKQPNTIEEFAQAFHRCVQDPNHIRKLPTEFEPIIQMLKDFIAENIVNDHSMESLVGKVVRAVDEKVARKPGPAYSMEYSKSRAYDIVMALSKDSETSPAQWNESLALPHTGTSRDSDSFTKYFSMLDEEFPNRDSLLKKIASQSKETNFLGSKVLEDFYADDPVAESRRPFGPTPVYCIDSATAHEIDDGISIQQEEDTYRITVHVANPTSYIKPDSILSQIAFKKGATVYMPEGPSMMLPQLMSRICGLNGTAEKTRTIAIEYELTKSIVDKHIEEARQGVSAVDDDAAMDISEDIIRTACIRFYDATNFPKGFTYEKVNEILDQNEKAFKKGKLAEGSHEDNLFKLFHISGLLKHARVKIGHGLLLGSDKSRVSVTMKDGLQKTYFKKLEHGWEISASREQDKRTPIISVMQEVNQNEKSRSQQLVSEHMIGANYAGSQFAARCDIPFIHRTQELDLSWPARKAMRRIMRRVYSGKGALSIEEMSQILAVMTSANYESARKKHESLGLDMYSNLTSPLRRYIDMINHWNVQAFMRGKPEDYRKDGDLDYIANRLQISESITKNAVRKSETFWTGKFLEHYFAMEAEIPEKDRIRFSMLLQSNAKAGDVRAELVGFGALRLSILSDDNVRQKFASGQFRIGTVLRDAKFNVIKLDCIENDLTVQLM